MGFLKIGSGGGLAIALLFDIIAISTPGWIYVDSGNGTYAQGLFSNLSEGEYVDLEKTDAENVAIAFNVMADVILVIAVAALCFAGGKGDQEVIAKVGGVLSFVGGIFIMIGMGSYTGMYSATVAQENVDWGYSFAFGWLAFSIAVLAAPVAFIDRDD